MTEDVIELCDTFDTKVCSEKLIFGDFNAQPILPEYYDFLNDDDEYGNNTPCTPVFDILPNN